MARSRNGRGSDEQTEILRGIWNEMKAVKASLESQSELLASEVIRMVLKPATVAAAGGRP